MRTAKSATAVPVPNNASLSGLVGALLVTVTFAVLAPSDPGVKVTLNAQLLSAGRLLALNEHGVAPVADRAKSAAFAPVTAMLVMFNGALPVLVSITVRGVLGVPTG